MIEVFSIYPFVILIKWLILASVDTTGDSYDNALADTVNGLQKSEVIDYLKEYYSGINDIKLATLE